MARLRALDPHELDDEMKAICAEAERGSGSSASARTMAHHAPAAKTIAAFRRALGRDSVLDPALVEMMRLKIARRNLCRY